MIELLVQWKVVTTVILIFSRLGRLFSTSRGVGIRYQFSYYYRVDDKEDRVNYVGVTTDDFLHCCKVEQNPNVQTIRGSGVCPRSINFHDYRCDISSNILDSKSIPGLVSFENFLSK